MKLLRNTVNLSKFLLSAEFRNKVSSSDHTYILCKNGEAQFVIHNIKAFEQLYELGDFGRRMMDDEYSEI